MPDTHPVGANRLQDVQSPNQASFWFDAKNVARAASKSFRRRNANIRSHVQNDIVRPQISPKQLAIDVSLWIAEAKQEAERIASFMQVLEVQSNLEITDIRRHFAGCWAGRLHFPNVPGRGTLKFWCGQHVGLPTLPLAT
jgi:hypothetical protein